MIPNSSFNDWQWLGDAATARWPARCAPTSSPFCPPVRLSNLRPPPNQEWGVGSQERGNNPISRPPRPIPPTLLFPAPARGGNLRPSKWRTSFGLTCSTDSNGRTIPARSTRRIGKTGCACAGARAFVGCQHRLKREPKPSPFWGPAFDGLVGGDAVRKSIADSPDSSGHSELNRTPGVHDPGDKGERV